VIAETKIFSTYLDVDVLYVCQIQPYNYGYLTVVPTFNACSSTMSKLIPPKKLALDVVCGTGSGMSPFF
jgi:hypothetical protein